MGKTVEVQTTFRRNSLDLCLIKVLPTVEMNIKPLRSERVSLRTRVPSFLGTIMGMEEIKVHQGDLRLGRQSRNNRHNNSCRTILMLSMQQVATQTSLISAKTTLLETALQRGQITSTLTAV